MYLLTMLRNLLLSFILGLPAWACGQSAGYKFVHFDTGKGLSHNQVNCFLKDSQGFLWIGTQAGFNRFDGYSFRIFRNESGNPASLANNSVFNLMEDPAGNIWVGDRRSYTVFNPHTERFDRNSDQYARKYGLPDARLIRFLKSGAGSFWISHPLWGLCRYDSQNGQLTRILAAPPDTSETGAERIADFREDSKGRLWIIRRNGTLELLDVASRLIVFRSDHPATLCAGEPVNFSLFVDSDDDVWLYSDDLKGGQVFEQATGRFFPVSTASDRFRLRNNVIRAIAQDDEGNIWIATDHGGIALVDKRANSVRYLLNDPDDEHSLSQNSPISLYKDATGAMWVGTYKKGFNLYHKNNFKFPLVCHRPSDPHSLPANDLNSFVEDAAGNLWIGSNGNGLICYDRRANRFAQYRNIPGNPGSLSNDVIVSMRIDREQKLWIGTYCGGLNCLDGKTFRRYQHDPANPNSLSDDRVWEIFEDSRHNLWVGTLRGGLNLFDRKSGTFRHFHARDDGSSVRSEYVSSIAEDRDGNLWIGTDRGVDVLQRLSGTFRHYENDPARSGSLSNNVVTSIIEDKRGNIWVATLHGLNLFNKYDGTFQTFGKKDGLPDDAVMSVVEDEQGGLWMGTPNGLSNLVLTVRESGLKKEVAICNYSESEGLQSRQFNEDAVCKTRRGELIFGGPSGFNIFFPADIDRRADNLTVRLTDFQVFNQSIRPGEELEGKIILQRSIAETGALTLAYSQNVFSIEFAALNFFHLEKNAYSCKLEGFNKDWFTPDYDTRRVTYTNLDPGEYVFRVKASNVPGKWSGETTLKIRILPPFWRSHVAYFLYFLLILGALLLAGWIILDRQRMNFRLEQERLEAQRTHELDLLKIKFLTNISHEFRTPLTLILSPLERLLQTSKEPETRTQLELMSRNARRLLNQVNQLLDFKKLEVEETTFTPASGDMVQFIREISHSFSEMAGKKHLAFVFESRVKSLHMTFDQAKMSRVMYNLLSNAFKFTPGNGQVTVTVNRLQAYAADEPDIVEIKVSDTGIGIPSEVRYKIFDRFYQHSLPGTMVNQGSGIGLSITREFVKLHDGTIQVDSEEGKGSTFTIRLPVRQDSEHAKTPGETAEKAYAAAPNLAAAGEAGAARNDAPKPSLLLVDDNPDFRSYLREALKQQYEILEAPNGKKGLETILNEMPDLVVSDVVMPEMDGIELCRLVKGDQRISHIPLILLTAHTAEERQLQGYETGADAYITKPFQFDILSVRIQNLIRQKEHLRKKMQRFVDVKPSEVKITSLDEQLIEKAIEVVEQNISNAEFSVEDLSHALAMSRVYLYKKLLALTGKTPIEFIRIMRLKRAAQLLEKSQLTIAEVAYKVGFNNPKYFARYFREEFGMLPTAYQKKSRTSV